MSGILTDGRFEDICREARVYYDQPWAQMLQELIDHIKILTAEDHDITDLFDLQHKRIAEAIKLWRLYHPGNDLVHPDLGALLTWLIEMAFPPYTNYVTNP